MNIAPAGRTLEEETALWFQTVWARGVPEDAQLLTWTLPKKQSRFIIAPTAERLARAARELRVGNETYVGTCAVALDARLNENGRGEKKDLAYAPALTIDLDLAGGPGRKKPGLFASREEIATFIARLPLHPTLIVDSGYGFQLWWVLRELIVLNYGGLAAFERLSHGWTRYVSSIAKTMERTIDPAWDATRVLRLPGTFNRKIAAHPLEVRVVEASSDLLFNESDFAEHITEANGADRAAEATGGWQEIASRIVVVEGAQPRALQLETLLEAFPKAKASWKKLRADLPDQSPSGYWQSLANIAALAKWSDQEITDLLIAWREKHSEPLEPRRDKYARTIFKARHPTVGVIPEQATTASSPPPSDDGADDDTPRADDQTARTQAFDLVRKRSGIRPAKIVRSADRDTYILVAEDGREVIIGETKELYRWRRWQEIATDLGIMPPAEPKRAAWDTVVRNLIPFIEQADDDFNRETLFKASLAEYAATARRFDGATLKEKEPTVEHRKPFTENGSLFITSAHFLKWMLKIDNKIKRAEVKQMLKKLDFVCADYGTGTMTRSYWSARLDSLGEVKD